jgi:hypothetical protein
MIAGQAPVAAERRRLGGPGQQVGVQLPRARPHPRRGDAELAAARSGHVGRRRRGGAAGDVLCQHILPQHLQSVERQRDREEAGLQHPLCQSRAPVPLQGGRRGPEGQMCHESANISNSI